MNESITKWSQKEFKAYLLLYAANSNQNVTDEEKEFIESKFDKLTLKKCQKN